MDERAGRERPPLEDVDGLARALLEAAPDALLLVGTEGRMVLVNAQAERLFGYARDEMLGQPVEMLLPERFRAAHGPHRAGFFADPRHRPMGAGLDLSGRRRDGAEFPVEISLSPIETPRGRFVAAAIRDATERRKVEARFRGLLESAPDAMVIVDRAGAIVLVNAQAEAIFGYGREEMLGQPLEMLIPERYRDRHAGHRAGFFHQPKARPMGANLDLHARRRDGTEFPVEISLSPLETEEGLLISTAIRDVTERRKVESALRSQTMTRTLVRRLLVGLIHRGGIHEGTVRAMGRDLARESGVTTLEENIEAFRGMGLGDLRVESREGATYTFSGDDLLERRAQAQQPTCYLSLSYLEGTVARASGGSALGTEIRCQSQGHERCRFVVLARPAPPR